eukprot:gnl/TRDRNA2_/TRDRNA2_82757_c0_seq1.p1 gnl/TRDRNA2_/TRDRNA2_82757_c0~~gnl/TRDRNA2_/TRDRNA2_82757_c0_seq1.p1  ORF type:complete len:833 (-),score=120.51 gnl/TRDRNA2_/TRDRNA2_82757_c0_seq1:183-2660(-)
MGRWGHAPGSPGCRRESGTAEGNSSQNESHPGSQDGPTETCTSGIVGSSALLAAVKDIKDTSDLGSVHRSFGPPSVLMGASPDAPPPGYLAHKGCLFPDPALASFPASVVQATTESGKNLCLIASSVPTTHDREGQRASRWRLRQNGAAPVASEQQGTLGTVAAVHSSPGVVHTSPHDLAERQRCRADEVEVAKRASQRRERRARVRAERRSRDVAGDGDCTQRTAVLWLRDDLRLDDNPALHEASNFAALVCVFIHDTQDPSPWPLRGAARYWKYESLRCFAKALREVGTSLFIRAGPPAEVLPQVCAESGADVVIWNRLCEPWYRERDLQVEEACRLNGLEVRSIRSAAVLWEPWEARPDERNYDRGFGSVGFYRSAVAELGDVPEPLSPVSRLPAPPLEADCREMLAQASLEIEDLGYNLTAGVGFPQDRRSHNESRQAAVAKSGELPKEQDWAAEMKSFWRVGERAAAARLQEFLDNIVAEGLYEGRTRFRADRAWTAILSPYIRFGELSPRRCYHESMRHMSWKIDTEKGPRPAAATFQRRFFWRDLAYWSLWRWPHLPESSLRTHYESQRWTGTEAQLRRWQRGKTGFPLVDAAMRQLWRVGWMPNYLRHVCAQFLIEYLDIGWKKGYEWFDYTLVDSDVAINAYMWQNGGHSGLDQWNFVMHPVYAAKSCDPEGHYVRRWLPELRGLPTEYIHCPWEAPARLLLGSNVLFRRTYHERILEDLDKARREHTREVLRVRQQHSDMVAKGGNEWFEVREGYWVTLITRDDYRQDTEVFVTQQTADDPRNQKRRQLQDSLSLVMGDFVKKYDRTNADDRDVL